MPIRGSRYAYTEEPICLHGGTDMSIQRNQSFYTEEPICLFGGADVSPRRSRYVHTAGPICLYRGADTSIRRSLYVYAKESIRLYGEAETSVRRFEIAGNGQKWSETHVAVHRCADFDDFAHFRVESGVILADRCLVRGFRMVGRRRRPVRSPRILAHSWHRSAKTCTTQKKTLPPRRFF